MDVGARPWPRTDRDRLRSCGPGRLDRGPRRDVARAVRDLTGAVQPDRARPHGLGRLDPDERAVLLATVGCELRVRVFPDGSRSVTPPMSRSLSGRLRAIPIPHGCRPRSHSHPWGSPCLGRSDPAQALAARRRSGDRPRDRQALERRLALKLRDGGMDVESCRCFCSTRARTATSCGRTRATSCVKISARAGNARLARAGVSPGGNAMLLL